MNTDLASFASSDRDEAVIGRFARFLRRSAVFAGAVSVVAACGGGADGGSVGTGAGPDAGGGGNGGASGGGSGSSSGSTFPGSGTCAIAGAPYASGAPNPANVCQICAPAVSTTSWSSASNGTSCGSGEICNAGSCFSSFCDVGGTFYTSGAANPSNLCQSCEPLTSTSAWTPVADGSTCGAGDACHAGICESGCGIGGVYYAPGAPAANGCESCQPATSGSAWSHVSDGTLCVGGSCAAGACAVTFGYTGTAQSFTVPPGVAQISVMASGAAGTSGTASSMNAAGAGGLGASVTATIPVAPGEVLAIYVGGTSGFNGGGLAGSASGEVGGQGGDGSDVRQGGSQLANRVLVAAGGGGGGSSASEYSVTGANDGEAGGAGGGATGQSSCNLFYCGQGGTAAAGGAAGTGDYPAVSGSLGVGGAGQKYVGGGGGGGGYYGGGGGAPNVAPGGAPEAGSFASGGGGGGSSYVEPTATGVAITPGVRAGVGQVVLSY